jgi:hypothetical protein
MISTVLLKFGKNNGIAVYVPKETFFKEMAAKIKLSQHFFFNLFRELSGRTLYVCMYKCMYGIYNIYKASVGPGSVQQIMPYH